MELEELRLNLTESFRAQSRKISERFGGLARKQLMWQPERGKWSVGQCLYHLYLCNEKYLKFLEHTVRHSGVTALPTMKYRSSWLGKRFIHAVGPRGFAGRVPKTIVPHLDDVPKDIVKLLEEQFSEMETLLVDSKGKDLMRIKIPSPFIIFIRFQAGDALKAIEQHNERHIAQATRLLKLGRFPAMAPVVVTSAGVHPEDAAKGGGTLY